MLRVAYDPAESPDLRRNGRRPLPATATDAEPGTEAKISVLAARRQQGDELHDPRDRQLGAVLWRSA